jgi:hypothetical protein
MADPKRKIININHNGRMRVQNSHQRNKRVFVHPRWGMTDELREAIELVLRETGKRVKMVGIVHGAEHEVARLQTFEAHFREAIQLAKRGQYAKALSMAKLTAADWDMIPDPKHAIEEAREKLEKFIGVQAQAVERNPDDPKFKLTGIMLKIADELDEAAGAFEVEHPVRTQLEGAAQSLRSGSKLAREGKHAEAAGIQGVLVAVVALRNLFQETGIETLARQLRTVEKFWGIQTRAAKPEPRAKDNPEWKNVGKLATSDNKSDNERACELMAERLVQAGAVCSVRDALEICPELRKANPKARRNSERKASRRRNRKQREAQAS